MSRRKRWPDEWRQIAAGKMALWQLLGEAERERIGVLAEGLVATKRWEAARGFTLTDEVLVTIATQAAVLALGLDDDAFAEVRAIIVHPTSFSIPGPHASGISGVLMDRSGPLDGEAHHNRGPLLIAWDQARYAARHRGRGRNVVWHEFAHKIDMLDGVVDGTPPIDDAEALRRWIRVCSRELRALRRGEEPSVLDPYAATDPGEFFAVATETFFDRPAALRAEKPQLYDVFADFYRQDPAAREPAPFPPTPG
jgi:Mlc titration factor MtfA (ptsG expression regulator)